MSSAAKMPWPMAAVANAALPPKPGRVGPLHHQLDHPGEPAEQEEVEGQDHEGAAATHPAAEFLDADGADPAAGTAGRRRVGRPAGRPLRYRRSASGQPVRRSRPSTAVLGHAGHRGSLGRIGHGVVLRR